MSDPALPILMQCLPQARGRTLWVVDEHGDAMVAAAIAPRTDLIALSNRCDVVHALQQAGHTALLSDFSFESWGESSLDTVVYRISKEKAVVHHIINAALERLRPGGELWLIGGKQEGIKTYLDKAVQRACGTVEIERHGAFWFGAITRGATLGAALDDQRYTELRELIAEDGWSIWSKPGIYGWQKIDRGSQLLVEQFASVWPDAPASVLDIGCGYGYLSMCALQRWSQARVVATDNNLAATHACEKNLAVLNNKGAAGERSAVVLADCAQGIDERFEAVICNPPFHQGFDVESDLTSRFLRAAREHLSSRGRALFVVNQFIPLERKAQPLFRQIREIARANGFKIILLEP
jgi:16S rRNA (guanine1207-N2)-methyltransferase